MLGVTSVELRVPLVPGWLKFYIFVAEMAEMLTFVKLQ